MKIIDATWEKRNLGVIAKEINIDAGDTAADLEQIRHLDCDYAVVRIPAGEVELMFKLQEMGYLYIETLLTIQHDHKNIGSLLNPIAKRISDGITCAEMSEPEFEELKEQFRKGIFSTDRIALDPAFSLDKSAGRYIGWVSDELAKGGKIYKCVLEGKIFGCFVSRINEDNENYISIIGTYKEYENAGLGICLVNASLRQAAESGRKLTVGALSTNNITSLRAHLCVGYQITKAHYIYVRHCD